MKLNQKIMIESPFFIVIEGCSGSGKSTLQQSLKDLFVSNGFKTLTTKQPSLNFKPDNENKKYGLELFELLIEDRKWHVENVITPALNNNQIIICDRYIPSSLVYQQIDGLENELIWNKNLEFPKPNLTIFLNVSDSVLKERLSFRNKITRFEEDNFRQNEIVLYKSTAKFLIEKNWNILELDTENLNSLQLANLIYDYLSNN